MVGEGKKKEGRRKRTKKRGRKRERGKKEGEVSIKRGRPLWPGLSFAR